MKRTPRPEHSTPHVCAPETKAGKTADRPADVYGLGMLLACLLKAADPLGTTRVEGGVASNLSALIQDLTAADPDDRPPGCTGRSAARGPHGTRSGHR